VTAISPGSKSSPKNEEELALVGFSGASSPSGKDLAAGAFALRLAHGRIESIRSLPPAGSLSTEAQLAAWLDRVFGCLCHLAMAGRAKPWGWLSN
jgi:hypothetical protein